MKKVLETDLMLEYEYKWDYDIKDRGDKYYREGNVLYLLKDNGDIDSVAAYQEKRHEGKIVSFFKNLFYKLMNKFSNLNLKRGASDFRMFRKNMVDAILSMPEYYRFSKGIFSWVGFNTYYLPYEWGRKKAFR